jgi:hypothetical protein
VLHQGCCAESNTEDDDDEDQTSSGWFNLDYCVHPKKRDQAQNEPIASWPCSLSRNVSPVGSSIQCAASGLDFAVEGLFAMMR